MYKQHQNDFVVQDVSWIEVMSENYALSISDPLQLNLEQDVDLLEI